MKIHTHILGLFFTILISAFATTPFIQNYGLGEITTIQEAQASRDDRWIRYDGNLYEIMDPVAENNLLESIVFIEDSPRLVGAKINSDREFIFHNHQQYQKFRTDWYPKSTQTLSNPEFTVGKKIVFGGLMVLFISYFARSTRQRM